MIRPNPVHAAMIAEQLLQNCQTVDCHLPATTCLGHSAVEGNPDSPRYQLTLEVGRGGSPHAWRFVLRPSDGHRILAIEDREPGVYGEQLELLTLIRGLEALDQPSTVTAYGCGRYLRHGITYGLPEWRENGWQWERFGQWVAIKHMELWQRLDRAMQIHRLTFGVRRIDSPHGNLGDRHRCFERKRKVGVRVSFIDWVKCHTQALLLVFARVVPHPRVETAR
ncbi:MAG: hypothetical protein U1E05_24520 [Patescibacteria group bacterium]|nr:hypothetical protein [Patescibacteria group bacterium]